MKQLSHLRAIACLSLAAACTPSAWAHKESDAYLQLSVQAQATRASYAVALQDLDTVLPLDANADAQITAGEIRAALPITEAFVSTQLRWQAPAGCEASWSFDGLETRTDGVYSRWAAQLPCAVTGLDYPAFANVDAQHRLLVSGSVGEQALLRAVSPGQTMALDSANAAPESGWATLVSYFNAGLIHLFEGYDHLAFLLALLLPLHLSMRASGREQGQDWLRLLKTITAFTLGHSITLAANQWGWVTLPSTITEVGIALSIGISAWWVIKPLQRVQVWMLAGAFGLIHGLGFSGQLSDMQAPASQMVWALAGFNLGVEAAQLLFVAGWVVLLQAWVNQAWYRRKAVPATAIGLMVASGYYTVSAALG